MGSKPSFLSSVALALAFLFRRRQAQVVPVVPVAEPVAVPIQEKPSEPIGRTPVPLAPAKPKRPVEPIPVAIIATEGSGSKTGKKTLVGVVGVTCAGLLMHYVPLYESGRTVDVKIVAHGIVAINRSGNRHLKAYQDQVGIWTICDGDTKNVHPGEIDTPEQCDLRLEQQLIAHAEPVMKCAPELKERPYQLAASISLAYNIGPVGFCRSTVVKMFHLQRWNDGCDHFLAFNKAGGHWNKGLDWRRHEERKICREEVKIL